MNHQDFYRAVHAKALELDPALKEFANMSHLNPRDIRLMSTKEVWLTSTVTGHAVTANVNNGAEWIVKNTHRLATDEEIKAELVRREAAGVDIRKVDAAAKGRSQPEMLELAAAIKELASSQLPKKQKDAQAAA